MTTLAPADLGPLAAQVNAHREAAAAVRVDLEAVQSAYLSGKDVPADILRAFAITRAVCLDDPLAVAQQLVWFFWEAWLRGEALVLVPVVQRLRELDAERLALVGLSDS